MSPLRDLEEEPGDKPKAPRVFVSYPVQEALNYDRTPQGGPSADATPVAPGYADHYRNIREQVRLHEVAQPLYFNVVEASSEEIELRRDGSVALHLSSQLDITVIAPDLAAHLRIFDTADEAQQHAGRHNRILYAQHAVWVREALHIRESMQAQLGRVVVQAATPEEPRWYIPGSTDERLNAREVIDLLLSDLSSIVFNTAACAGMDPRFVDRLRAHAEMVRVK